MVAVNLPAPQRLSTSHETRWPRQAPRRPPGRSGQIFVSCCRTKGDAALCASRGDDLMTLDAELVDPPVHDGVSNVLKWILLAVAVLSFALFGWATKKTYERAPPEPARFVTAAGATVMTNADIVAGKAGFQKADLMDYGSLY